MTKIKNKIYNYYLYASIIYLQIALRIRNKLTENKIDLRFPNKSNYFKQLDYKLSNINKKESSFEWFSKIFLQSTVFGILGLIIGILVSDILAQELLKIELPFVPIIIADIFEASFEYIIIISFLIIFKITYIYTVTEIYLSYVKREKRRELNEDFKEGIMFATAIVRSDDSVETLINKISKNREHFGEFGNEIYKIDQKKEEIGLREAINYIKRRTPSNQMKNFLNNLQTSIESNQTPKNIINSQYERVLDKTESDINEKKSIIKTILVSLFVVIFGLLLGLLVLTFLSILSSQSENALFYINIYFLPITFLTISVIIYLMKSEPIISEHTLIKSDTGDKFSINYIPSENENDFEVKNRKFNIFYQYNIYRNIKQIINLNKLFKKKPVYSLILTLPLTILYYIFIDIEYYISILNEDIIQFWFFMGFIPFLLLLLTPYIYLRNKSKKESKVSDTLIYMIEDFRKEINSNKNEGDIMIDLKDKYDILSDEIKQEYRESMNYYYWNKNPQQAWIKFGNKVKVPKLSTFITTLKSTMELTDDLEKSIETTLEYIDQRKKLEERINEFINFLVIPLLISSFVIVLILIVVYDTILIDSIISLVPSDTPDDFEMIDTSVNESYLSSMYKLFALESSIFIGLIIGQFKTGNPISGVLYALIMNIIMIIVLVLTEAGFII